MKKMKLVVRFILRRIKIMFGLYYRGTIYSRIDEELQKKEYYYLYDRNEKRSFLNCLRKDKQLPNIIRSNINLIERFPENEGVFVEDMLAKLVTYGFISHYNYDKNEFLEYRDQIKKKFYHSFYHTYIFPEEERLLYAISQILSPKNVIVIGSFYGYWAAWLMPVIKKGNGFVFLVDIDKNVCKLAERNLKALGFMGYFETINEDVIEFIKKNRSKLTFDFAILDAEGAGDHENLSYRRKSIYSPIIEVLHESMVDNAILVCHDISLHHDIPFDAEIHKNSQKRNEELRPFIDFVCKNWKKQFTIRSTEGVGVYLK